MVRYAKVCGFPGCPELVKRGYCDAHQPKVRSGRERRKESFKMIAIKRRVIREQPFCAEPGCDKMSEELDHIVPLARGGHPTNRDNLQLLCRPHHAAKTQRERAEG